METKHHRARVFKDPYNWPSWQIYYADTWIGSAHTLPVAQAAAVFAVKYAGSMCEQNLSPFRIIQEVNHAFMGQPQWMNMWKPGLLHINHTQHRDLTRAGATHLTRTEEKVTWTWQPLAA